MKTNIVTPKMVLILQNEALCCYEQAVKENEGNTVPLLEQYTYEMPMENLQFHVVVTVADNETTITVTHEHQLVFAQVYQNEMLGY